MTVMPLISQKMLLVSARRICIKGRVLKAQSEAEVAEYQITKRVSMEETEHGGNWGR